MLPTIDALKAQWKGDRLMRKNSTVVKNGSKIFKQPALTIGLDLGDRTSCYCVLDGLGNVIVERGVPTTPSGIRQAFGKMPRSRIALETGTHSPWVSRQLARMDHEVIVAHARNVRLIGESSRKDDQLDARTLARLARIDPGLLGPVRHRSAEAQIQLTVIRARAALVSTRTALVNAARGLTKSYGERLKKCGTEQMNRDSISKEGDRYLRTLMVQGAHYILGPFGQDSDLRRWGLKLAERGGKNAKKRAVVAVARKLSVLLHKLWVSGEIYEPLRNNRKAVRAVA
jgi:transposase